ncbi:MAG: hypothetical protein OHK0019_01830 [Saprospiraceae bacterium]
MKNLLFAMALLSIMANCKKNQSPVDIIIEDPIDTPIIELGKSFVLKNGTIWEIPFHAWYYRTDTLFQFRAKILHSNLVSENFFIRDIPCEAGKYPIEFFPSLSGLNNGRPESAFIMMYEYDQPIGDFVVDTTRTDHFVEVIRYDSVAKTVEGRFQVFLGKKPTNVPFPGVPDSIFMTEGKFHLKIEDP